ncbi:hypothetical protein FKM82_027176, partial [Ascaphus truei]
VRVCSRRSLLIHRPEDAVRGPVVEGDRLRDNVGAGRFLSLAVSRTQSRSSRPAMVSDDLPDPEEPRPRSSAALRPEVDGDSGVEEEEGDDSTIFLAFKGDIGDTDCTQKLDKIMQGVPGLISMGMTC